MTNWFGDEFNRDVFTYFWISCLTLIATLILSAFSAAMLRLFVQKENVFYQNIANSTKVKSKTPLHHPIGLRHGHVLYWLKTCTPLIRGLYTSDLPYLFHVLLRLPIFVNFIPFISYKRDFPVMYELIFYLQTAKWKWQTFLKFHI